MMFNNDGLITNTQEFEQALKLIKLRFVYNSTPLDIVEALETNLLTREEWFKLHTEVEYMRKHNIPLTLVNNMQYRVHLEAGDYNVNAIGINVQNINIVRVR